MIARGTPNPDLAQDVMKDRMCGDRNDVLSKRGIKIPKTGARLREQFLQQVLTRSVFR